jgi:hypothetical protein
MCYATSHPDVNSFRDAGLLPSASKATSGKASFGSTDLWPSSVENAKGACSPNLIELNMETAVSLSFDCRSVCSRTTQSRMTAYVAYRLLTSCVKAIGYAFKADTFSIKITLRSRMKPVTTVPAVNKSTYCVLTAARDTSKASQMHLKVSDVLRIPPED